MASRDAYIPSNILKIDDFADVVLNDVLSNINQKYILEISYGLWFKHSIIHTVDSGYIDGFDLKYDFIGMK